MGWAVCPQVLIDRLLGEQSAGNARAPRSSSKATKGQGRRVPPRKLRPTSGPAVVVVESPAKCATISKFLGPDYVLKACYGHVRALPSKAGAVEPAGDFEMSFELVRGADRVVKVWTASAQVEPEPYLFAGPTVHPA